ncbi:MAG: hypothetical protein JSS02_21395 [Planctomycetes bacterium]|nr:hypothetical protein [Planctomycetota bacterium]
MAEIAAPCIGSDLGPAFDPHGWITATIATFTVKPRLQNTHVKLPIAEIARIIRTLAAIGKCCSITEFSCDTHAVISVSSPGQPGKFGHVRDFSGEVSELLVIADGLRMLRA